MLNNLLRAITITALLGILMHERSTGNPPYLTANQPPLPQAALTLRHP